MSDDPNRRTGGPYEFWVNYLTQSAQIAQRTWGEYVEAVQKSHKELMDELTRGKMAAETMRFMGIQAKHSPLKELDYLSHEDINHKFLTENSEGEIVEVTPAQMLQLFPQTNDHAHVKKFPRVIITASHARGKTESDMRHITHGVQAMARDSQSVPTPLNLGFIDQWPPNPDQTIVIFRNDSEHNFWLNGAGLLDRVNELIDIALSGKADTYEHASPGAKAIAKLMLAAMVTEPERIDVQSAHSIAGSITAAHPLCLRSDAALVAQHFFLHGYSKGGTTVSDAMRYLVDELLAKDAQGRDLVHAVLEHESQPITATGMSNVRNIVRNIACIAQAALEDEMADRYNDAGVRRDAINAERDLVSRHDNYKGNINDRRFMIEGWNHEPTVAMGTCEDKNGEAKKGEALNDPRVRRRYQELTAPHYGKAALADVRMDTKEGRLTLVTAAGTTDEAFEAHRDTMLEALFKAGIEDPVIDGNYENARLFGLHAKHDIFNDVASLEKLHAAFMDLRQNAEGLLISDGVLLEDIPEQIKVLGGTARATELIRQTEKMLGYTQEKTP